MVDQDPSVATRQGNISISSEEAEEAIRMLARLLGARPSGTLSKALGQSGDLASRIYNARSDRRHFFDEDLFSDPAWDMLLVLFSAALRDEKLSVTSVVRAANASYTTGLRWLTLLEKQDLVQREPHPTDRRASFVILTGHGRRQMDAYMRRALERHLASDS